MVDPRVEQERIRPRLRRLLVRVAAWADVQNVDALPADARRDGLEAGELAGGPAGGPDDRSPITGPSSGSRPAAQRPAGHADSLAPMPASDRERLGAVTGDPGARSRARLAGAHDVASMARNSSGSAALASDRRAGQGAALESSPGGSSGVSSPESPRSPETDADPVPARASGPENPVSDRLDPGRRADRPLPDVAHASRWSRPASDGVPDGRLPLAASPLAPPVRSAGPALRSGEPSTPLGSEPPAGDVASRAPSLDFLAPSAPRPVTARLPSLLAPEVAGDSSLPDSPAAAAVPMPAPAIASPARFDARPLVSPALSAPAAADAPWPGAPGAATLLDAAHDPAHVAALGIVDDPFARATLEDEIADVLERAALEAGVDLS